jgi:hypothetical protein
MGGTMQVALYGLLLSTFFQVMSSPTWARTSTLLRGVISFVVLLTTVYTAFCVRDIWFFGTIQGRDCEEDSLELWGNNASRSLCALPQTRPSAREL